MNIFDRRYCSVNKYMMCVVGLWPEQSFAQKIIRLSIVVILLVSVIIPQWYALTQLTDDLDRFIECLCPIGTGLLCIIKLINFVCNNDKMQQLYVIERNDWASTTITYEEREVMRKHAEFGRKLTMSHTIFVFTMVAIFISMPAVLPVIDLVVGSNNTREAALPYIADYGIDINDHYIPVMIQVTVSIIAYIFLMIIGNTTYPVHVEHACAKFDRISCKLEQAIIHYVPEDTKDTSIVEDKVYRDIVICVKQHVEAIRFAELIDSSFTVSLFFEMGCCVVLMSMTGVQTVLKLSHPEEMIRYLGLLLCEWFYLLIVCFPGDKLIEHSLRVSDYAYSVPWYLMPTKTRRLIWMMVARSHVPCKQTAGKMSVMSMGTFSSIMRTSMSYFTMLTSVRE